MDCDFGIGIAMVFFASTLEVITVQTDQSSSLSSYAHQISFVAYLQQHLTFSMHELRERTCIHEFAGFDVQCHPISLARLETQM